MRILNSNFGTHIFLRDANLFCEMSKHLVTNCIYSALELQIQRKMVFERYFNRRNSTNVLMNNLKAKDWKSARVRVSMYPSDAKQWSPVDVPVGLDERKVSKRSIFLLPLHMACFLGAPVDLIEQIIAAFPVATKLPDKTFRRYPLHYACMAGSREISPQIIHAVCSHNKDATIIKDRNGKTPLDYAAYRQKGQVAHSALVLALYPY